MRAGAGFRVVLDREDLFTLHPDPGHRLVVEVDMGDFQVRVGLRFLPVDGKTVVLGSDLPLAGQQVHHGVVDSPVPMVHFIGTHPVCAGDHLMSQTDPKKGLARVDDFPGGCNGILQGFRVPGAVGDEIPIRVPGFHGFEGSVMGEDLYVGSPFGQVPEDVFLDTYIQGRDPDLCPGVPFKIWLFCRDPGGELQAFHAGDLTEFFFEGIEFVHPGGDDGIHGAVVPDITHQCPGIHV